MSRWRRWVAAFLLAFAACEVSTDADGCPNECDPVVPADDGADQ